MIFFGGLMLYLRSRDSIEPYFCARSISSYVTVALDWAPRPLPIFSPWARLVASRTTGGPCVFFCFFFLLFLRFLPHSVTYVDPMQRPELSLGRDPYAMPSMIVCVPLHSSPYKGGWGHGGTDANVPCV